MNKCIFIAFLLYIRVVFAQATIEYEIHNRKIDDRVFLNDFLLIKNSDTYWDVEGRVTNTGNSYLVWTKIRYSFFKNGSIVDSQTSYLDFDTYENYGMVPKTIGLFTSLKSKVDFDSIAFEANYEIDSGDKLKLNENALALVETNFTKLTYSETYSKWIGSVKNASKTIVKFPKVFSCFFSGGSLLHIDECYLDVQNNTIQPDEIGSFDHLLILPSDYDSVQYLTHYSIGLTGPVVSSVETTTFPSAFHISQNYPNPFNSTTTIDFSLDGPGIAVLSVFDITGKMIFETSKRTTAPGEFSVSVDLTSFPSGTYFYRLSFNHKIAVKSMTFIK